MLQHAATAFDPGGKRFQRHLCLGHHIGASVQERRGVAEVVLPQSAATEERQPVRTGRYGTTMITKSMSIILLLMAALLLGTIASIHAQSQPRLQQSQSAAG
ncbi:MAG: hypothetical protein WA461_14535 [Nitrososphaeraceae archaeon]